MKASPILHNKTITFQGPDPASAHKDAQGGPVPAPWIDKHLRIRGRIQTDPARTDNAGTPSKAQKFRIFTGVDVTDLELNDRGFDVNNPTVYYKVIGVEDMGGGGNIFCVHCERIE